MYLHKKLQIEDEIVYGFDDDGTFFKGIVRFIIVDLRESIPFVIKAFRKSNIEGKWISTNIEESNISLLQVDFKCVIFDNHSTNAVALHDLRRNFGIPTLLSRQL